MKLSNIKIGSVIGRLTINNITTIKGIKIAKCNCVCGTVNINIHVSNLGRSTNSCGCLRTEVMKDVHRLAIGDCTYNNLQNRYKSNAKKRGYEFSLGREEFRKLISDKCHYCGFIGKKTNRYLNRDNSKNKNYLQISDKWIDLQWITVNGLDRKDNTKGYILENVLSCCDICNKAKHMLKYEEFIEYLNRVTEFRK